MIRSLSLAAVFAGLAGCASYRPAPLPRQVDLALGLPALNLVTPSAAGRGQSRRVDPAKPLTADEIGLLAILNNPDLKDERGTLAVAKAALVQATLLPNPSATLDYGQLIAGPGTASSIGASLSQDIAALVTRDARVRSAKAHVGQVDADLLWREWQVAEKARQLAVDIVAGGRAIALTRQEHRLLLNELAQVKAAVAKGDLTVAALAPLLTAIAAAEKSLQNLRHTQLKNWQSLDGLLGLVPSARFLIAPPVFGPLPAAIEPLVAALPETRPDLAALRLGYLSAEENVREAILGQFPAFSIGASYASDTSKVVTAGPTFTFALPVFDRNQGNIAKARATRALLREQYQARLDSAVANVRSLLAQLRQLAADLRQARRAAAEAHSLAVTARKAYAGGNLDQRALVDYETTALERAIEVADIERSIGEDRIFLAVELGLDLPRTRIALSGAPP